MKKVFIAAALMVVIIAVRMAMSVALTEQAANVFCSVSLTALFLYFLIDTLAKSKSKSKN